MNLRLPLAAAFAAIVHASAALAQGALVDVIEYYHADFDHYFMSSLPADIAALDSGNLKGWARTGLSFKAYDGPAPSTSPVCRFYIPPAQGNSHFYSASPAECAEVAAKFPAFSFESPSVMYVGLPDAATGACNGGWAPVFRLWNQRADSNHRYSADRAVRAGMLARGYVAEGYGPEGVAMCTPDAGGSFDLVLSTPELLLLPGDVRNVYVTVAPQGAFTGNVTLSLSGLPPGVTGELSTATITVGANASAAVLRLTVAASASPTTGNVTFVAQSGSAMTSTALTVGVAAEGDPIAVRLRAIAQVEDRMRELLAQGTPLADTLPGMAAFMAAHPQYEEAGIDADFGNAWGRQKDGTVHVVAGNYRPGSPAARRAAEHFLPKSAVTTTTPYALLSSSIWGSGAAVTQIRKFLSGRGWYVEAPLGLGVRTLATAKNVGFLYLDGPSGRGRRKGAPNLAPELFGVASDTAVAASRDKEFALELASGNLVHITGLHGSNPDALDTRYGITEHFVRQYMTFQPDGVVLVNAPSARREGGFVAAFHDKGASVFLGWDGALHRNVTDAYSAAAYLVDRMVGANEHHVREDPPQRPFPYDLVLADMSRKGLDRAGSARLAASPQSGTVNRPIFAPSIQYVTVDEMKGELTLTGNFSTSSVDVPRVTVGGVELDTTQWSSVRIVAARLPFNGAGANGDVVVEVKGVRSNARQLTDWTLLVTYEWSDWGGSKGLRLDGNGELRFRADVGGYRLEPAEAPRYKVRSAAASRQSFMEFTASGKDVQGNCTATASGSQVYYPPTRPDMIMVGDLLGGAMVIDPKTLQGGVNLMVGSVAVDTSYVISGPNCGNLTYPMPPIFSLLDGMTSFPEDQSDNPAFVSLPAIKLSFDTRFAVPSTVHVDNRLGGTIKISWPSAAASSPPRDAKDAGK